MTGQKGNTKKIGSLNRKYRVVPANVRRVLYRPDQKPPRLYFICAAGVAVCNPKTFSQKKLIKRGYKRVKMSKNRNQQVWEKQVG